MNEMIIRGVRGRLNADGVAELNLEDSVRGLGFTYTAASGNEVIRWARVREYLSEYNVATSGDGVGSEGLPEFITENVFYRLCFKGESQAAKNFQNTVFDEVLPAIRKTGSYSAKPMSAAELSLLQAQALVDIEKKQVEQGQALESVTHRLDTIGDLISLNPNDWRRESKELIVRIARVLGGNAFIKDVNTEIYALMLSRFKIDVHRRLAYKRARAAEEGMCKSKREKLNKLDVIADDKRAIEAYLTLVREMAIKYGLDKEAS